MGSLLQQFQVLLQLCMACVCVCASKCSKRAVVVIGHIEALPGAVSENPADQ